MAPLKRDLGELLARVVAARLRRRSSTAPLKRASTGGSRSASSPSPSTIIDGPIEADHAARRRAGAEGRLRRRSSTAPLKLGRGSERALQGVQSPSTIIDGPIEAP